MASVPGDAVPAVGRVKSVSFWAADEQRGPLGTGGSGEVRAPGPLTQQLRETPDGSVTGLGSHPRPGPDATVMSVWHSLGPMAEKR